MKSSVQCMLHLRRACFEYCQESTRIQMNDVTCGDCMEGVDAHVERSLYYLAELMDTLLQRYNVCNARCSTLMSEMSIKGQLNLWTHFSEMSIKGQLNLWTLFKFNTRCHMLQRGARQLDLRVRVARHALVHDARKWRQRWVARARLVSGTAAAFYHIISISYMFRTLIQKALRFLFVCDRTTSFIEVRQSAAKSVQPWVGLGHTLSRIK